MGGGAENVPGGPKKTEEEKGSPKNGVGVDGWVAQNG